MWDLDNARVKEILHGLAAYPDFVSGEITDAEGKQIAREGNPDAPGSLQVPVTDIVRTEAGKKHVIGHLAMRISAQSVVTVTWQHVWIGMANDPQTIVGVVRHVLYYGPAGDDHAKGLLR